MQKNEVSTRFLHADKEDHTTLQVVRRGAEKTQRDEFPMQHTQLSRAQVESAFTCLPDAVYCEDTQKPEVLKHIFALAEKHNCPVLFRATTGRAAQFFKDGENTGKQIRVLLADEREAATLTGSNTYSISNLAIKLSICISASYYVINFGRRGIYLYDGMHTRELYPSEMREGGEAVTCMAAFSGAFAAGISSYPKRSAGVSVRKFCTGPGRAARGGGRGGVALFVAGACPYSETCLTSRISNLVCCRM